MRGSLPNRRRLMVALVACLTLAGCGASQDRSSTASTASSGTPAQRKYISKTDCETLQQILEEHKSGPVEAIPDPTPPFSHCTLQTPLGLAVVYLDATAPIRKRYLTRVEGVGVARTDPAHHLHPIDNLGEGEPGAYWVPGLHSLYAYDREGWITVFCPVLEGPKNQRAAAVALARRGLALTVQ